MAGLQSLSNKPKTTDDEAIEVDSKRSVVEAQILVSDITNRLTQTHCLAMFILSIPFSTFSADVTIVG